MKFVLIEFIDSLHVLLIEFCVLSFSVYEFALVLLLKLEPLLSYSIELSIVGTVLQRLLRLPRHPLLMKVEHQLVRKLVKLVRLHVLHLSSRWRNLLYFRLNWVHNFDIRLKLRRAY